jgi:hypothetical protein
MPVALSAEPGGAEFAAPAKAFSDAPVQAKEPDPEGRITRDQIGLIHTDVTVVPAVVKPGDTVRVHVEFRPNTLLKAHWNNEVDGLVFQVKPPAGWTAAPAQQQLPLPDTAVSTEPRRVEFELQAPDDASGSMTIPAYALYYVCEDVSGTCLYRRLEVPVVIAVQ